MAAPSEKTYRTAQAPSQQLPLPSVHDPASVTLTVVIPAYNEAERRPGMLASTLAHLVGTAGADPARTYEVLVLDDGSRDGTAEVALKVGEEYAESEVGWWCWRRTWGRGERCGTGCCTGGGGGCSWSTRTGRAGSRTWRCCGRRFSWSGAPGPVAITVASGSGLFVADEGRMMPLAVFYADKTYT